MKLSLYTLALISVISAAPTGPIPANDGSSLEVAPLKDSAPPDSAPPDSADTTFSTEILDPKGFENVEKGEEKKEGDNEGNGEGETAGEVGPGKDNAESPANPNESNENESKKNHPSQESNGFKNSFENQEIHESHESNGDNSEGNEGNENEGNENEGNENEGNENEGNENEGNEKLDEIKQTASLGLMAGLTKNLIMDVEKLAQKSGVSFEDLMKLAHEESAPETQKREEGSWQEIVQGTVGTLSTTSQGLQDLLKMNSTQEVSKLVESSHLFL